MRSKRMMWSLMATLPAFRRPVGSSDRHEFAASDDAVGCDVVALSKFTRSTKRQSPANRRFPSDAERFGLRRSFNLRFGVPAVASLLMLLALPVIGSSGAAGASAIPHTTAGESLMASQTSVDLGSSTVGSNGGEFAADITLTNISTTTDTISGFTIGGADPDDFFEFDDCGPNATLEGPTPAGPLAPGQSCDVLIAFMPGALGARSATVTPVDGSATAPVITVTGTGTEGYYEVTADGEVATHGDANPEGDTSELIIKSPIVASASTGDNSGYWLAASDGGIFAFGDAQFFGSTGALHLNKPIVGMAATPDDEGYWLVASDGGIFSFGDAPFFGSTGGIRLNKPIVGMAATPDGGGYWLVASDGGVFSFGDASYFGSTGGIRLNQPIVGMATTPDGGGYWLVASDGGIFAFGDANFFGSNGAIHLNKPIVSMAATPDGGGYWLMASDGGVFAFGDAPFEGSSANSSTSPFVSIMYDAGPTLQSIFHQPAVRKAAEARLRALQRIGARWSVCWWEPTLLMSYSLTKRHRQRRSYPGPSTVSGAARVSTYESI